MLNMEYDYAMVSLTNPGDALSAISDDVRRGILAAIGPEEATISDLVDKLAISQPQVSKHLAVLREAELVRVRPEGKWRFYSVDGSSLERLAKWLERFSATINQRLDRLEDVVAEIEEGSS